MKILRVIRSLRPEGGGPVEGIYQSTTQLVAKGHQVELLCLDTPGGDYLERFQVQVHAIGPAVGTYGYCSRLGKWLEDNCSRFDAVIVHGLWQYIGYAVRKALKNKPVPYYVFTHGMLDPWFKRHYPLKHYKKLVYWLIAEYKVLRDARYVLFTTQEECRLARESFSIYSCNEYVVNYGTGGQIGDPQQQKETFYARFPALRESNYILFLSRIHPKKGIDLLFEAFSRVKDSAGDLKLVVAGPNQVSWASQLKAQADQLGIASNLIWTGMLEGDVKWGAYLAADAFILPSHQENFGIVVAEALSCSTPVLISNKVNIWREIEEDGAGIVADDTSDGCEVVLRSWLKQDAGTKLQMSENARKCFNKRFEISAAADALIEVLGLK